MRTLMKAGRKKPALKRAARRKLASCLLCDARRIGRREAVTQQRFGGPLTGREREVDALARNRVDEPRRVAGQQPARSGDRQLVGVAHAPATESATRTARAARRARCRSRESTRRSARGAPPRVSRRRLGADADRQVSRARKRPDVAGRIGDERDHDLRARDAVREEAGRDRELIAPERSRDATAQRDCWRRRRRSRRRPADDRRRVSSVTPSASTRRSVTRAGSSAAPACCAA